MFNVKLSLALVLVMSTNQIVRAQDESVHFFVTLDKAVLLPGESAKVSVFAAFHPDAGEVVPVQYKGQTYNGTVLGYGSSPFDIYSQWSGVHSTFSNLQLNTALNLNGHLFGTPVDNAVLDVGPSQLWPGNTLIPDNPIFLWSAIWTPAEYTAGEVQFNIMPKWASMGLEVPQFPGLLFVQKWDFTTENASLMIVPGPGFTLFLISSSLACVPRRR